MPTNFPTSLDSLTNPSAGDSQQTVSHSSQHANENDAIEALEAKVGIDGSAVQTSHDYKLSDVTSSAKAVPNGRQVIAGTGLTGGGTLAADRTLAVAYGSSASTACEGNDSRLSDARTPTAHAASHAAAGSDPLTLAQSQVTGLTAALAAKEDAGTAAAAITTHEAAGDPHPGYLLESNVPSQAEAEAGTATTARAWTAERVAQAIAALAPDGGASDHGALTGLSDDDHAQYALLAGRSSGQTVKGGTASGESLTLQSTDHATRGGVKLATSDWLDMPEVSAPATPSAGRVAIYAKSDGKLYIKDDAGTETDLTALGGGSSPGGVEGSIQTNNGAGGFGAADMTWLANKLTIGGGTSTGARLLDWSTDSSADASAVLRLDCADGSSPTTSPHVVFEQGGVAVWTLDRAGKTTQTGPVLAPAGSVSACSFAFSGDPNTGLYRIGADNIGLATNGVLRFDVSTSAVTSTLPIIAPAATTSIPSIRLPHGTAPSSPTDGDEWSTAAGRYSRVNGVTKRWASAAPEYLTLASSVDLDSERSLSLAAIDGLKGTDGGAGSNYALALQSARLFLRYTNDFFNVVADWMFTVNNNNGGGTGSGNSTSSVSSLEGHPGVMRQVTGTGTTGSAHLISSASAIKNGSGQTWVFETLIRLEDLSDGTDTYTARWGFLNAVTSAPTVGAWFEYTHSVNSGKFEFVTGSGDGGPTRTDTAVTAAADTWYRLRVVINGTTSADWAIYDEDGGTALGSGNVATDIPGNTVDFGVGFGLIKSAGSTSRQIYCDMVEVLGALSSSARGGA